MTSYSSNRLINMFHLMDQLRQVARGNSQDGPGRLARHRLARLQELGPLGTPGGRLWGRMARCRLAWGCQARRSLARGVQYSSLQKLGAAWTGRGTVAGASRGHGPAAKVADQARLELVLGVPDSHVTTMMTPGCRLPISCWDRPGLRCWMGRQCAVFPRSFDGSCWNAVTKLSIIPPLAANGPKKYWISCCLLLARACSQALRCGKQAA